MTQITIDNLTFNLVVRKTTKRKLYIRVKEDVVYVSVTKKTKDKEIINLLQKHIDFIRKKLIENKKQDIIHFGGREYKPVFTIGKKGVNVIGDEIHISAPNKDIETYKKVLYAFYKQMVEQELDRLMNVVKNDFREINLPKITVRYMKSMFGNYRRVSHEIKLSSILAKYDFKYIKVVLYHELSHVYEFNHSKKFYMIFESKYPNAKRVDFTLKKIKYNDCL